MASVKEMISSLGKKAAKDPRVQQVVTALQTANKRASNANASAREVRQQAVQAAGGATLVGAFAGGLVDGVIDPTGMGWPVNASTVVGVVVDGAGMYLESPTIAAVGGGMAAPAFRNLGESLGSAIRGAVFG